MQLKHSLVIRSMLMASLLWQGWAFGYTIQVEDAMSVRFSLGGVALPESERIKLIQWLERVRDRDWCALYAVSFFGYVDPVEGSPKHAELLRAQRVEYVRGLLQFYGLPGRLMYEHVPRKDELLFGPSSPQNTGVLIWFQGYRRETNCTRARDPSGFRTITAEELKRLERF
jgi:hypothetical protein